MKYKSHLKDIDLTQLILLPRILDSGIAAVPVMNYKNEETVQSSNNKNFNRFKDKVSKLFETNIKRLEKVRKRIVTSKKEQGNNLLDNLDLTLQYLKKNKSKFQGFKDLNEISHFSQEVAELVLKNDVTFEQVFDGRKDNKIEKAYNKLDSKLTHIEVEVEKYASDEKNSITKYINKARNLIEQLRNEDKNDKDKFMLKGFRSELNNTINEINRTLARMKNINVNIRY